MNMPIITPEHIEKWKNIDVSHIDVDSLKYIRIDWEVINKCVDDFIDCMYRSWITEEHQALIRKEIAMGGKFSPDLPLVFLDGEEVRPFTREETFRLHNRPHIQMPILQGVWDVPEGGSREDHQNKG